MLLTVLLVCFVVVMILWGLSLGGAIAPTATNKLAFVATLILGIVVFLYGSGVIVVERPR